MADALALAQARALTHAYAYVFRGVLEAVELCRGQFPDTRDASVNAWLDARSEEARTYLVLCAYSYNSDSHPWTTPARTERAAWEAVYAAVVSAAMSSTTGASGVSDIDEPPPEPNMLRAARNKLPRAVGAGAAR